MVTYLGCSWSARLDDDRRAQVADRIHLPLHSSHAHPFSTDGGHEHEAWEGGRDRERPGSCRRIFAGSSSSPLGVRQPTICQPVDGGGDW